MRLAGAGRQVTVLEREAVPGGRAGRSHRRPPGPTGSTPGPTVLTMPDLIADAFDAVGEDMADWLDPRAGRAALPRLLPRRLACSTCTPTSTRWPTEIERVIGPAEAAGYRRYVDFVSKLYRYEMRDFIDRNIDSPARPADPRPRPARRDRRLPQAGAQGAPVPDTTRAPSGIYSFQAMYAGLSPVRRAGDLRRDRLHGLRRRRLLPQGRHARRARGHGRGGREARRRVPLRHRGHARRDQRRPRRRRASPPTASASPPTSSCSTPTCRSPTATCSARSRGRCGGCTYSPSCFLLLAGLDRDVHARSPTTTSTSAGAGAACSTSSSTRSG